MQLVNFSWLFFTSAKEVMFSPVFVCLSVNGIDYSKTTGQIVMKFRVMDGHSPGTNRLDSE